MVNYHQALAKSVTALTRKAYKAAGKRYDKWCDGLPKRVWKVKDGLASRLSIVFCVVYITYLFSQGKGTSMALHFLGYVNMARLAIGAGRLTDMKQWAIIKQLLRAIRAGKKKSQMTLPDLSNLMKLL